MVKTLSHEQPWCTLTACNFAPDLHIHVFFISQTERHIYVWLIVIKLHSCQVLYFTCSGDTRLQLMLNLWALVIWAFLLLTCTSAILLHTSDGKCNPCVAGQTNVIFINVGAHNQIIKSIPVGRFCEYSHTNSFQFYCWTRNSMSKYAKRCMAGWCPAYACNAQRQN